MNQELVDRATALAPRLRERAAACEQNRAVPRETIDDFLEAGIFHTLVPKRYGGLQADWETLYEILIILGRADCSQAWIAGVFCMHALDVTMFGEQAQNEVWGDGKFGLVCSGVAPSGRGQRIDGGVRLSGRWGFSSGNVHADWAELGAMLPNPETGELEYCLCLVPRSDCHAEDTWYTMGLEGTGSSDLIVEDKFVPDYRIITRLAQREGTAPGAALHDDRIFASPYLTIGPTALGAIVVGCAFAALDDYVAFVKERAKKGAPGGDRASMQLRVAEAAAELDCARMLLMRIAETTTEGMRRDGYLPADLRARSRRDAGYSCILARRAVERLFEGAGAHGLYRHSPFQRHYRNVKAGTTHFGLSWDRCATAYGSHVFGIDPGPDAF
ncbi:MAG: acyl-CoA dehydrogenase family protein [Hyphomicrobiales bacterium]|nr:acyl-CoA dehydrogenase family protein [Hyphomicrobiales bacterium]